MAFTQQNEKDGYLFFAVAFNAVPGKVYAAQVVQAYEAGMTTQQIVNEFTTKAAFTNTYATTLTNSEFAQAFVANVTKGLTTPIAASVLTTAIADIEAALAAGLTRGDVVYNVISNLSLKSTADLEWGPLVTMLDNKVTVAEALTEGEYALNTTDAGALTAPLASVTNDPATVEAAIKAGGELKVILEKAVAAQKAVETYADGLGLLDANGDAITGSVAVETELGARLDKAVSEAGVGANYAAYAAKTATQQSQDIAAAKTNASNGVVLAQDALTKANADVAAVPTLQKAGADWDAAVKASTAATKAADLAQVEIGNQVNVYNVGKADAAKVSFSGGAYVLDANGTPKTVIKAKTDGSGTFEFDATVTAELKTALTPLLTAVNNDVAADKAAASAATAATQAEAAVDALDNGNAGSAKALLAAVTSAKTNLESAQKAVTDLNTDLADLAKYEANQKQLDTLQKAQSDAAQKLVDAGYTNDSLDGSATNVGATKAVFLLDAANVNTTIAAFTSDDHIYVGSTYSVNASADLTKGNNSALEVFFKANGSDTDVYIEQKAFGSSVTGAANGVTGDIIKVTLTGVAADKVVLKDGLITVAA